MWTIHRRAGFMTTLLLLLVLSCWLRSSSLAFTFPVFDSNRRLIIDVQQDKTVAYYHYHDSSFLVEKNSNKFHHSKVMSTNDIVNKLITTYTPASSISLLSFNTNLLSSEDLGGTTPTITTTTTTNTGSSNVIGDDNVVSMQQTSSHDEDRRTNPEINIVTVEQPRTNNDKENAAEEEDDDVMMEFGEDHVVVDADNNDIAATIGNKKPQSTIEEGNEKIVTIEKGDERERVTMEEEKHLELDAKDTVRIKEEQDEMENLAAEEDVERGAAAEEEQQLHAETEAMKLIEQHQQHAADRIAGDQTTREEEKAKDVGRLAVEQKAHTETVTINDQQEEIDRMAAEQKARDDEAIKMKQIEDIELNRVREEETMTVKQEEAERIEKARIEAARAAEEEKMEQEQKIARIALAREELIARLEKEEIVRKDTIAKLEEQVRKQEMESFKTEAALRHEEEVLAKLEKDESLRIVQIERLEAQVLKLEQAQDEAKLVLDRLRLVEQTREDEASKATDARKAIDAKIKSISLLRTPPQLQETLGHFTTSITAPSLPSFDDTTFEEAMVQLKTKLSVSGDFDLTNIPQKDVALVAGSGIAGLLIVAAIGSTLDNNKEKGDTGDTMVELIRDETRRSSSNSRQYDFNDEREEEASVPYGMREQQQGRSPTSPTSSIMEGSFGTREQGRYPPPTPSDIQEQDAFARNERGRPSFGGPPLKGTGSGFTQSSFRPPGLDNGVGGGGGGGLSSVSDNLSGKFEPSSSYGTPPPFRSAPSSLPIMKGSSSSSGYTTVPPRKGSNASGGMSKSFGKSSYNKKG